MNTGQVLLVIFAFVFLSTVMLNFNQTTALGMSSVDYAQRGILLNTVATSYAEIIRGLSYDEQSDTNWVPANQLTLFTPSNMLGPESAAEDSISSMNDVDDFNGQTFEKEITGTGKIFRSIFHVYYVNPQDPTQVMNTQTLVKRVDMDTWQISPPVSDPTPGDTLHSQILIGYYHFN
jgi:hypothetical protein